MLSTVLIGNSNTFVKHGLMITPRGYANKYDVEIGNSAARDGEKAGHSLSTGLNGWLSPPSTRRTPPARRQPSWRRAHRLPETTSLPCSLNRSISRRNGRNETAE